ncbi:DinB family protein [Hymenobacter sp. B1770]|uniref:DinB family protein n=1 Tax=Hymenobacter sp. B1770 TaxID=1718788 RepID=UPI003CED052F
MNLPAQIAQQVREVHFGGNWTVSNLQEQLAGLTWQQATARVASCNSIAALVYHINYYISACLGVLRGEPLTAHDKYSFAHPPINSQADWEQLLEKIWADARAFAYLIEQLPEHRLWETMADEKYGNFYRNLHGIVEHTHYHLGQIALLKKLLTAE